MTKQDIMQVLEAIIEKDKADACSKCAFFGRDEWEMPCAKCSRASKDYLRPSDFGKEVDA